MGTETKSSKVVSLAGDPIFHYDEPAPYQPPMGEMCLEQISAHIEQHVGPVETVFHELVSDTVHIDVHILKPTLENPHCRLITSGMSDLPMTTPDGLDVPRFAELMITLPSGWQLDQDSFKLDEWYWPVRLIKSMARLPHKYATWLGFGHTMPNGNPAEPFALNTRLCGAILVPPLTTPDEFDTLVIDEEKTIQFYSVVPIYQAEMDLKLRKGSQALLERLDAKEITDIVDIDRPDVARKRFGFF